MGNGVIVGKRVTFGAIIGGIVSFGAYLWDIANPDAPLPSPVVVGLTTAITGLAQIIIANKFGVTTE